MVAGAPTAQAGAMTTTPPDAPPGGPAGPAGPSGPSGDPTPDGPSGPRRSRDELRDLGRLRRSVQDRKIAGVAGGIARHLDIDPVVVRVALVVLVFFGGAGLLIYGACWLFVPEDGAREAPLGLDDRSRTVALVIAGVLAALALVGDSWGIFGFPWPVAVVTAVALILLTRNRRHTPLADPAPDDPFRTGTPDPYAVADPATTWSAPTYVAPPRRRGPILFGFTLALVALGIGVLATVDLAGAAVPSAGYPALALTIIGAMLVLGAFWGRAGGLVLLGLIALVGMAVASGVDHIDNEQVRLAPTSASTLPADYHLDAGELIVDLTAVSDVQDLDDRTLILTVDVGRIEVIVPEGVDVNAVGRVDSFGNVILFGSERSGLEPTLTAEHDGGLTVPDLEIDARVGIGEVVVTTSDRSN